MKHDKGTVIAPSTTAAPCSSPKYEKRKYLWRVSLGQLQGDQQEFHPFLTFRFGLIVEVREFDVRQNGTKPSFYPFVPKLRKMESVDNIHKTRP
jgi:hypothetical protein